MTRKNSHYYSPPYRPRGIFSYVRIHLNIGRKILLTCALNTNDMQFKLQLRRKYVKNTTSVTFIFHDATLTSYHNFSSNKTFFCKFFGVSSLETRCILFWKLKLYFLFVTKWSKVTISCLLQSSDLTWTSSLQVFR